MDNFATFVLVAGGDGLIYLGLCGIGICPIVYIWWKGPQWAHHLYLRFGRKREGPKPKVPWWKDHEPSERLNLFVLRILSVYALGFSIFMAVKSYQEFR